MKAKVALVVFSMASTVWARERWRGQVEVPQYEKECWSSYADWEYKPKYGYLDSIEKARAGDAEAKFCFAKYCSAGHDENHVEVPRDAKKAGALLLASAEGGFGPAEYAMVGMIMLDHRGDEYRNRFLGWLDCRGFQNESGESYLGMRVRNAGYYGCRHSEVSNAVAKAMPYLRRAQQHGVPLTENYFKRIQIMVRGYEQRERRSALNVALSEAAQAGDARRAEALKQKIADLEVCMRNDLEECRRMDDDERRESEEKLKIKEAESRRRDLENELRGAGVDKPFVQFNELEKISYEDCLAKAKEGFAPAYYWLAFYFKEGKQVERDPAMAYKFLAKAADMKCPAACYTVAQLHESWSLVDEDPQLFRRLLHGRNGRRPSRGGGRDFSWEIPELTGECSLTNDVVTSFVLNLYREAQQGGLSYATNDIARLEASIAACKERIAKAKDAAREKELADRARRDNTQRALGLLAADDGESKYVENAMGEAARRQFVGRVRSRMAQTAPDVNSNYVAAVKSVEARFKVALIDMTNAARWSSGWKAGNGRSCILIFLPGGMFGQRMGYYEKYDAEGRLVMISKDRADFEELKALDSELSDKSRSRSDEAAVGQMNLKSLLTEKH